MRDTEKKTFKTDWIKFRVSPDEKVMMSEKAAAGGITVAELIRKSVARTRTWALADKEIERERIRELRRIGHNLNQIARWANEYQSSANAVRVLLHLVAIEKELHSFLRSPAETESPESSDAH